MSDSAPVLIVCPSCATANRVPRHKLAAGGKCGRCGGALFDARPVALGARDFDAHLSKSDIPLLVDFWAAWCGPCRQMAPAFEQAARQLEPKVRVVKVNTDEAQGLGAQLNIRSIPTLALFLGGREIARQAGAMGASDIVRWTQSQLSRVSSVA